MNYSVTKFVTKFILFICIALVVLLALGGVISTGVKGLVIGFFTGLLVAIPLMMYAEAAHALITIAENTKK